MSVWGNISKRAEGSQERKEDINQITAAIKFRIKVKSEKYVSMLYDLEYLYNKCVRNRLNVGNPFYDIPVYSNDDLTHLLEEGDYDKLCSYESHIDFNTNELVVKIDTLEGLLIGI